MIGKEIELTIVDVRGEKVRLGIMAPSEIPVHRKEIFDAIAAENQAAATIQPNDLAGASSPFPRPAEFSQQDLLFMQAAIDQARMGLDEGGLPIGSVLVRNGQIIGAGHNRRIQHEDPMAHAEIDCLTNAGRQTTYRDTVLYSTLMPCFLCSGAVVQFGIPRVVAGESTNFNGHGSADFLRSKGVELLNLHNPQCIEMMRQFIQQHPDLWHEDIGK
jgi:cytosine deaminase